MLLSVAVPPPDPDPGRQEERRAKKKKFLQAFLVSFNLFREPGFIFT